MCRFIVLLDCKQAGDLFIGQVSYELWLKLRRGPARDFHLLCSFGNVKMSTMLCFALVWKSGCNAFMLICYYSFHLPGQGSS